MNPCQECGSPDCDEDVDRSVYDQNEDESADWPARKSC